jgi:hypothetical protein
VIHLFKVNISHDIVFDVDHASKWWSLSWFSQQVRWENTLIAAWIIQLASKVKFKSVVYTTTIQAANLWIYYVHIPCKEPWTIQPSKINKWNHNTTLRSRMQKKEHLHYAVLVSLRPNGSLNNSRYHHLRTQEHQLNLKVEHTQHI